MAHSEKCSEMQIIIHGILVFVIGILIGTSLIPSSESNEISLVRTAQELADSFARNQGDFQNEIQRFQKVQTLLDKNAYESYNVQCQNLTSYFIEHSEVNGLKIDFYTKFHKLPMIFLSVNGFDYKPQVFGSKDTVDFVSFSVNEVTKESFRIKITLGKDETPKPKNFNSISLCYVAFVNYEDADFES